MALIPVEPDPSAIASAIADAKPGDTIEIIDDYWQPKRGQCPVMRARGAEGQPIVIRMRDGKRLLGRGSKERGWAEVISERGRLTTVAPRPKTGDPFFKLDDSEHVLFEALTIVEAWPIAIDVCASRDIAFARCIISGGKSVFRIQDIDRGGAFTRSGDILVDGCHWVQDRRLWNKVSWDDVHDGALNYLNGALLRTDNIAGPVEFRNNVLQDAYNGIKCVAEPELAKREGRNRDFNIHGNRFTRIRDNPFEPEGYAFNWHLHDNVLVDCHGWFSFDGVRGGSWYIYANRAWFETRQGDSGDPDGHRRGFVFKMALLPADELPGPIYVFNNSFHLRIPLFGNAQDTAPFSYSVRNWFFHDNVFEWRAETQWKRPEDEPFVTAFEPGVVFEPPFSFTGNLSNAMAGWHAFVERLGVSYGWHNHYVHGHLFADGRHGDFELRRGPARRVKTGSFTLWLAARSTPFEMPVGRSPGACQPAAFKTCWPPFSAT